LGARGGVCFEVEGEGSHAVEVEAEVGVEVGLGVEEEEEGEPRNPPKRRIRCDDGVRGCPQRGEGLAQGRERRERGSPERGNVSVIVFDAPSWSASWCAARTVSYLIIIKDRGRRPTSSGHVVTASASASSSARGAGWLR
jgi:hypothetical protein